MILVLSSLVYFFKLWPLKYSRFFTTSPFFFDGPACSYEVHPHPTITPTPHNNSEMMAVYETDSHKNTFKDGGRYTNALVGIQVAERSPRHGSTSFGSSRFARLDFRLSGNIQDSMARFTIWKIWRGGEMRIGELDTYTHTHTP